MRSKQFGTCMNCIDGRVQLPVIQWIKKKYGIIYVDLITEPGMDGLLADKKEDIKTVLEKVEISINRHYSKFIFIAGHHNCAGNAVDDSSHIMQVQMAVVRVKDLIQSARVIGLWVSERWIVNEI